jgi:phosphoribosylanthranilate isomerase
MVRVKICGISEVSHAVAAADAGADFIGVVFAAGKRRVSPETAWHIAYAIKNVNPKPELVGVFVNEPIEKVVQTAKQCGLDRVQLSGDETIEYCKRISLPVIKAIHIHPSSQPQEVYRVVQSWYAQMKDRKFDCLLDTAVTGKLGGTGKTFDWTIAGEIASRFPVIVAGGLTPKNVAQAVRDIHPWGVDVSSGVETENRKDTEKINAFIRAVWNAE